ncbi:hypothetical protein N431DRAFT_55327 [Stipitochalara longipes BDJ]|nr:hypothetical protein N431DRAFT_55327 [Stipitochalara longipes BDJ]
MITLLLFPLSLQYILFFYLIQRLLLATFVVYLSLIKACTALDIHRRILLGVCVVESCAGRKRGLYACFCCKLWGCGDGLEEVPFFNLSTTEPGRRRTAIYPNKDLCMHKIKYYSHSDLRLILTSLLLMRLISILTLLGRYSTPLHSGLWRLCRFMLSHHRLP